MMQHPCDIETNECMRICNLKREIDTFLEYFVISFVKIVYSDNCVRDTNSV